MSFNFKNIHIGSLINQRINEFKIEKERICKFLKCSDAELEEILSEKYIGTETLMKFSTLLEYDFFRIYSQYLILFAPPSHTKKDSSIKSDLPHFRKSIYTKEIIEFVTDLIHSGKKSKQQIIEEYNIPKTTLHKWMSKYPKIS
ncbi:MULTISPECIES: transposase [unclassified Chryseobacterium]|uniref:transposase n=1 Tax=unclassified Chryseobacterium TaxID=2593645 RepID=UPI00100B5ACE|nr:MULTISPECIES: transposase [unclassified Chryseobacterium]RXM50618.1 transposase [Chryseobacterium sp. CH25]RXM63251.1 transposase [Chryseobacterium sp. CH1]